MMRILPGLFEPFSTYNINKVLLNVFHVKFIQERKVSSPLFLHSFFRQIHLFIKGKLYLYVGNI